MIQYGSFKWIIFLIFFLSSILKADDTVFRNTKWGMSKSQVKHIETGTRLIYEKSNELRYFTEIADIRMAINYYFFEDKLAGADYLTQARYLSVRQLEKDYMRLYEILSAKYGQGAGGHPFWNTYEVINGLFTFSYNPVPKIWANEPTTISINVGQKENIPYIIIFYSHRALWKKYSKKMFENLQFQF